MSQSFSELRDCNGNTTPQKMHRSKRYARIMYTTLIQTAELAASMADTRWAILDCRFELAQPDWGERAYASAHIAHAQYAHLDRDLAGAVTPGSGRHPLPQLAHWTATLGRWGIDHNVQVVAYDQGSGAYAARLWWLMRWVGHTRVAVLDGGYAAWLAASLPVSAAAESRAATTFIAGAAGVATVATEQIEPALKHRQIVLVDARGADRFAGANESIDAVAGHIPGATNQPFMKNLDARGRFLPAPELACRWQAVLGAHAASDLVSMCGSGVTACHNLLALEIAGLSGARLYPGSWSEWIRDPARGVARGAA
jgi:thiosulfate/3-mercaptopyruvate sulfurtransferase